MSETKEKEKKTLNKENIKAPPQVKIHRVNHFLLCIIFEHLQEYSRESWGLLITSVIDMLRGACLPCVSGEKMDGENGFVLKELTV